MSVADGKRIQPVTPQPPIRALRFGTPRRTLQFQTPPKKPMTQQEHLKLIRARCVELIEIAEKRTAGTWYTRHCRVLQANAMQVATAFSPDFIELESSQNAAFIASCAGAAEAGWRATIAAIDGLEEMDETTHLRDFIASNIIASWPAELL